MSAAKIDTHSDVLVLGGGLMGTSPAFFLRHRHRRSVTLFERELVGRQASGTNFGNVRRQGRALDQLPLANRARAVWGRMNELLGEDLEFVPYGHLRVCYTEAQAALLEKHAHDVKPLGLDLELLTAEQLRRRWGIFAPGVVAGSLSPRDGHANPRLAGPAFARAAQRAGAKVIEHAEVMHVERDARGLRCAHRRRCAASRRSVAGVLRRLVDRIASLFGEAVPLEARGPQMGVTEPLPYALAPRSACRRRSSTRAVLPPDPARQHRLRRRAQGPGACRRHPRLREARQHAAPAARAAPLRAGLRRVS